MQVTVLYFGVLREAMQLSQQILTLPADARASDVLAIARERLPHIAPLLQRSAIAVNHGYACAGMVLHDGDEIALLPPVSGGLDLIV